MGLFEVWTMWNGVGHYLEPVVFKVSSLEIWNANCSSSPAAAFPTGAAPCFAPRQGISFPEGILVWFRMEMSQGEDGPRCVSGGICCAAAPSAPL